VSRRRPGLPELPPGYRHRLQLKVVCSDRGQHACTVLHRLQDTRDVVTNADVMWPEGLRNGPPATAWQQDGALGFRFCCPRCRRDVQLRLENLFRILDGLAAQVDTEQAHPSLDISLLPC
jgi:hypothetical protein